MITSTIEIAAPPAKVRQIVRNSDTIRLRQLTSLQLLNFSAYPEWHTEWLKEIKPQEKSPLDLTLGDKINVNIENFKFVAEVQVNQIYSSIPCHRI